MVFDDKPFIIDDPSVHMTNLSWSGIKTAVLQGRPAHRYLPNISWAVNYYIGQLNPFGYHLVNLFIHLLTGTFLFLFIKNTLRVSIKKPEALIIASAQCNHRGGVSPRPGRESIKPSPAMVEAFDYKTNPDIIAFFAALIWIVQPVGTQSVTYICQRMASMVALFYVLSLLLYVKGRMAMAGGRKALPYGGSGALIENVGKYNTVDDPLNPCRDGVYPHPDHFSPKHVGEGVTPAQNTDNDHARFLVPILYFSGCLISAICAFATKENAGTLPLAILVYEWFFFQDLKLKWSRRQILWIAFVVIVFAGAVFWYMGENPLVRILNSYNRRDFTLIERVMTEWRIVVYYLSLFLWALPGRLNLDHDYPLSLSPVHPATTMLALAAILILLAWAVYSAKKERLIAFCVLWFFITQATESTVIGIELIFEHRTYIPFTMISLLFVVAVFRIIKNRSLAFGLLVGTALVFSVWTFQRNQIWQDPVTFWTDCAVKSTNKQRPRNNMGKALFAAGNIPEAVTQYKKAIQIDPNVADAHNNLGNALLKQGKTDEAVECLQRAMALDPNYLDAINNLGNAFFKQGRTDEAIQYYCRTLALNPNYALAHNNLGSALFKQGKTDKAIQRFRHALTLNPDLADAHNNLGNALFKQGKIDEAIACFHQALALNPDHTEAQNNMANALMQNGDIQATIKYFQAILNKQPDHVEANINIGTALAHLGRIDEAITHYRTALNIAPSNPEAHNNLGVLLAQKNMFPEAIEHFQRAVALRPGYVSATNNLRRLEQMVK